MKAYSQKELAALYEQQQSEAGREAMNLRKEFLNQVWQRTGVFVPYQEVGKMVNRQTGENRYYMKG